MDHELKCWSEYFQAVQSGEKPFEVRRFDRPYAVGDTLLLREWDPKSGDYTGHEIRCRISYLLDLTYLPGEDRPIYGEYVVLGLCRRAESENKPLTLDELRKMDGEPVWIVEAPDWGHWELSESAEDYLDDRDPDFYGMTHDDPAGRYGLHVLGWLAYARRPEAGKEANL